MTPGPIDILTARSVLRYVHENGITTADGKKLKGQAAVQYFVHMALK